MHAKANYHRHKLYKRVTDRMAHALQYSEAYQRSGNPADSAEYRRLATLMIGLHQYLSSPVSQN